MIVKLIVRVHVSVSQGYMFLQCHKDTHTHPSTELNAPHPQVSVHLFSPSVYLELQL